MAGASQRRAQGIATLSTGQSLSAGTSYRLEVDALPAALLWDADGSLSLRCLRDEEQCSNTTVCASTQSRHGSVAAATAGLESAGRTVSGSTCCTPLSSHLLSRNLYCSSCPHMHAPSAGSALLTRLQAGWTWSAGPHRLTRLARTA